ncbi:MAG: 30S ribosomal protein S7 [Candidatus Omnitrophica bacterium]|nr:30S ribosomal protein S7 [Candidatus Omnitrophota bacterium]
MMRRRKAEQKEPVADPKYGNRLLAKFINNLMLNGKKTIAENIVYGALEIFEQKAQQDGMDGSKLFNKAIDNVRPRLEVKARRLGGATYQVPVEVPIARGNSLAMRWIRDFARKKKGKQMKNKLADELLAAFKGEGAAVKKRDDTHKMAESNKAFSHLRW